MTASSFVDRVCSDATFVLSGTGHWLHMDKPDEFNRIRDEFFKDRVGNSE